MLQQQTNGHIRGRVNAILLGQLIAKARNRKAWTQGLMALKLKGKGLSAPFIGKLERGEITFRNAPTVDKIRAVCELLQVEVPYETSAEREPTAKLLAAPQKAPAAAVALAKKAEPEPEEPKKAAPDIEISALASASHALSKLEDAAARKRVILYLMERYAE